MWPRMRAKVSGIAPFKLISARGRQLLTDINISKCITYFKDDCEILNWVGEAVESLEELDPRG